MPLSRFFHESEKQYSEVFIHRIINSYGKNILIGGDPGYGEEFDRAMNAIDKFGAKKHVYLVGPGMEEWSNEEANEIKRNAKSIGIDTSIPSWKKEWFSIGWISKCKEWFTIYGAMGFYSAEIDNIDAALHNDPGKLVAFYRHLQQFCQRNRIRTKLMVKNLSESELRALTEAKDVLPFLAEFGMFEAGTGDSDEQSKLAWKIGIRAVTPKNGLRKTEQYGTIVSGIPF